MFCLAGGDHGDAVKLKGEEEMNSHDEYCKLTRGRGAQQSTPNQRPQGKIALYNEVCCPVIAEQLNEKISPGRAYSPLVAETLTRRNNWVSCPIASET
jgi:hypothetical protein